MAVARKRDIYPCQWPRLIFRCSALNVQKSSDEDLKVLKKDEPFIYNRLVFSGAKGGNKSERLTFIVLSYQTLSI